MAEFKKKKSFYEYFKHGRILVVDDMQNMRRTIRNMLRYLGISDEQIVEAKDGDTALKIIRKETEQIIFVLLDWNMPRLPGIEVLKQMKEDEKLRNINVLMITAENNVEQVTQAVENEVKNYVIKPFVAKTLEEKMLNIINPPEYVKLIEDGETLLKQGLYDKALTLFQEILKTKPNSASIRILMGKAYEEMKEYKKAHQFYKEAIEKNPQYLRGHNLLADFLLKTGDKKAALSSLEKAAEISPFNANRHLTIGELALESEKDTIKAQQAFEAAAKQSPEMAKKAAEIFLKNGNAQKAEEFFRKSLTHKGNVHTFNRLGIALRKQKKWKDAIKEYEKALLINPNDGAIFFNMGMAYLEGDKIEGDKKLNVVECLNKALKIDPNFKEAKEALEKLHIQNN